MRRTYDKMEQLRTMTKDTDIASKVLFDVHLHALYYSYSLWFSLFYNNKGFLQCKHWYYVESYV